MKPNRIAALVLALLVPATPAGAQTVTTVVSGIPTNGDVTADAMGNVYLTPENAGTQILKITPGGTVTTYATGFANGRGLAFDASGDTLYAAKFDFPGPIRKVAPDGTRTTFATNLSAPTSVAFGPFGDLYVCGSTLVYKIPPNGVVDTLSTNPIFNRPHGLAVDESGIIYVASAHDGNVYRVEESRGTDVVSHLAWIDGLQQQWACGFMTYHAGSLYITNGDNKVHRIDTTTGAVSDYAGTGAAGGLDGPADQATFSAPNGIWAAPDGTIWVSEWGAQRIRRIDPAPTDVGARPAAKSRVRLAQNRPNPFGPATVIAFELARPGAVELSVHDAAGRIVRTLVSGRRPAGPQNVRWDGRGGDGRPVAAGVYFYRLRSEEGERTRRMTILR